MYLRSFGLERKESRQGEGILSSTRFDRFLNQEASSAWFPRSKLGGPYLLNVASCFRAMILKGEREYTVRRVESVREKSSTFVKLLFLLLTGGRNSRRSRRGPTVHRLFVDRGTSHYAAHGRAFLVRVSI